MFRAFGLDNTQHAPEWTGEQAADAHDRRGRNRRRKGQGARRGAELDACEPLRLDDGTGTLSGRTGSGAWRGQAWERRSPLSSTPRRRPAAKAAAAAPATPPSRRRQAPHRSRAAEEGRDHAEKQLYRRDSEPAAAAPLGDDRAAVSRRSHPSIRAGPGRRMIPMRRIWERVGSVDIGRLVPPAAAQSSIAEAESGRGARRESA